MISERIFEQVTKMVGCRVVAESDGLGVAVVIRRRK